VKTYQQTPCINKRGRQTGDSPTLYSSYQSRLSIPAYYYTGWRLSVREEV